ncbi:MAG: FecR domain-containing protein [Chloroflexota bacterium]
MTTDIARILDECILRLNKGATIEACLREHPDLRGRLEPLLHTALALSTIPKASPSDEFRRVSKARLMARLHREHSRPGTARSSLRARSVHWLNTAWNKSALGLSGVARVAVSLAIAVLVALAVGPLAPNLFGTQRPVPGIVSRCTLSILGGSAVVQDPGTGTWQEGVDGTALAVGSRVKTTPGARVLLTFLDGSTIKLEPDTDVEIRQVEQSSEQATTIVLKQWLGRTWSRVTKMADVGGHYEIETPSATALVRGTLFTTEVDEAGLTQVTTTEGLVSLVAQGEEVYLPASQQSRVRAGTPPSQPAVAPAAETELVITVDRPVVASVVDPTGSSTGYLPSGLAFNQILGSESSPLSATAQVITVRRPMTGEYVVVLRYVADGTANINIEGRSRGEAVFQYTGWHEAKKQSEWLIRVGLGVQDGLLTPGSVGVGRIEPLANRVPEKIVQTELAKGEALKTKAAADKAVPEKAAAKDEAAADKSAAKDEAAAGGSGNSGSGGSNGKGHN